MVGERRADEALVLDAATTREICPLMRRSMIAPLNGESEGDALRRRKGG